MKPNAAPAVPGRKKPMTNIANLMGSGTPGQQAQAILGGTSAALTATGTTQADALALTITNSYVGTAASGTGVILPSIATRSDNYTVFNYGANALLVYPPVGSSIGSGSANAGFSVAAAKSAKFTMLTSTLWGVTLSA